MVILCAFIRYFSCTVLSYVFYRFLVCFMLQVMSLFYVFGMCYIYTFHTYIFILVLSYTFIFYLSYTLYFRILSLLFLCSYTYFHSDLYCTTCSCNCLYFHRIAVLCFSYHVIYSIHVISFLVSCLQLP